MYSWCDQIMKNGVEGVCIEHGRIFMPTGD